MFFDCFYVFDGKRPENSYFGLLLQLGFIGLLAFVAFGGYIGSRLVMGLRRANGPQRLIIATSSGVFIAGVVLTTVQSYVYSVGNIATLPFWTCAFVGVAAAGTRDPEQTPRAAEAGYGTAN